MSVKSFNFPASLFAALLCFIFLGSCDSDDGLNNAELPELTTTGKGTFGCLIDDNIYLPKNSVSGLSSSPAISVDYYRNDNYGLVFSIYTSNLNEGTIGMNLDLFLEEAPLEEGRSYQLAASTVLNPDEPFPNASCRLDKDFGSNEIIGQFQTNFEYTGNLNITKLDSISGIVSGTFRFMAYDPSTKQVLEVKDGRFDLSFK